jgi:hypothetical protein
VGDAAFGDEGIERDEQVEIDSVEIDSAGLHPNTLTIY